MYRVYVRYNMKPGAREGFLEALAGIGLRQAVLATGLLSEAEYDALVDPEKMV